MYQKIFSQIQGISANQIIEIEVQIAMARQKIPDMKKYLKNMQLVIDPLDPKFGVLILFAHAKDEETEGRPQTKPMWIQDVYVENLDKMAAADERVKAYDMTHVLNSCQCL